MSVGVLLHLNLISYLPASTENLVDYYTTVENNETINFIDTEEGNVQRELNALYIENVGDASLYVQPLPSKYIICIPAHESRTYDMTRTTGIKVIGNLGQTIRWSGCYY